jgi:polyisoprenoid-binding protein YceI
MALRASGVGAFRPMTALGYGLLVAVLWVAVGWAQQQSSETVTSEVVLSVDPAHSKVQWTLDSSLHMVHGTFTVKSGVLRFDPTNGRAGGEIVISATSGESGNGSRDARMHREILETAKYPELVFRSTQFDGKVAMPGVSDGNLRGVFTIHGADHDLVASVHADLAGDRWKGTSKFEVPYVKWGIKDPSNFLLRAKPVVEVELELAGPVKMAN